MWRLWRQGGLRLRPFERDGLVIVSAGFLIGEGQSLAMAAPLLPAALGQLVGDVDWGSLDVLLVDLPPGTADLHQQLLGVVRLDGAVVVVGSQDVAHLDGRKFVDFLEAAGVPVLGGVENMSGFVCPHCGEPVDVFPRVSEERSVWADGVPLIGRIPIEPTLARSPAAGLPSFDPVAARVLGALEQRADAARSPRRGPKP